MPTTVVVPANHNRADDELAMTTSVAHVFTTGCSMKQTHQNCLKNDATDASFSFVPHLAMTSEEDIYDRQTSDDI